MRNPSSPPRSKHYDTFEEKASIFPQNTNNPSAENSVLAKEDEDLIVQGLKKNKNKKVFLEGYVEGSDEDELSRTKSLTDDDLEELKGCLDLGFGFNYDEIPELCNTLPALELCYSMSQKYLDDQQQKNLDSMSDNVSTASSSPIPNWKISSPGDDPEDVKARLKFWAQAVACTVRLCS